VETTQHQATSPIGADEAEFIKAARTDDTGRFALLTERFRRELLAHCYRMLASYDDAQDLTQETFLRAWAKRESFQGRASLRTWLYHLVLHAGREGDIGEIAVGGCLRSVRVAEGDACVPDHAALS
jgi:hypothetical protein